MNREIGFSVSCYKGDIPLLRGCLASIRHFAPDAPICLVIDGEINTKSLEKAYNIIPIRRSDVKNPELRRWSYGFGITKMISFWEAPFEWVFHVDADCIMWGDIRKNLPDGHWDVVYNEPHEIITPHIQKTQYFDPQKIFDHIPYFHWQNNPYFQAGVIVVRRGSLDLDEYIRMLEGQRNYPDIFVNGDQGMLNILVFRALHAGALSALPAHLQTVVPVCSPSDLNQRYQISLGTQPIVKDPTILHWAGPKPYLINRHPFFEPMNFFRSKSMYACGLPSWFPSRPVMYLDEFNCRIFPRVKQRLKYKIKNAYSRFI